MSSSFCRLLSRLKFKGLCGLAPEFSEYLFRSFDQDNSNLLDIHEFLKGVEVLKLLGSDDGTRIHTHVIVVALSS